MERQRVDGMTTESKQETLHTMVVGVNHETSSVDLRDRLLFDDEEACHFETLLLEHDALAEAVVMSTCNRSEIYVIASDPLAGRDAIEAAWASVSDVSADEIAKHAYCFVHGDAVRHLYRVAASLDSLVVGESQIFGQLKSAFQRAQTNGSVSFYFNYLFQSAIRAGKRVRSETAVNEGAVSISFAAMELARKVLGKLDDRTIGIVGSGAMGALTAENMRNKAGAKAFLFFNRSMTRAKALAERFDGDVCLLEDIQTRLHECDVIVGATGAPGLVLTREDVELAMKKRQHRSLFLIDIAAPRDFAPDVGEVYNVFLFTIDDLTHVMDENMSRRQAAAEEAQVIIDEEVHIVEAWYRGLEVRPLIGQIRGRYDDILTDALAHHRNGLPDDAHAKVEEVCRVVLNRFLHSPLTELKLLGEEGGGKDVAYIARRLFDLPEIPPAGDSECEGGDE